MPVCVVYRDAVNEMALHFLAKMKILVVRDVEREDIEFICKVKINLLSQQSAEIGSQCFVH